MKKNKMMRAASGLLVATLLTTSVISGTFAKYITTATASDVAQVAKWGVGIVTSGSLFAKTYTADDTTITDDAIKNSIVSSSDQGEVVAPGTNNNTGLTFEITGKPEVAFSLDVDVTAADGVSEVKDVFLKAGTYADLTTGDNAKDYFELADDYYPINYTLKKGTTEVETGKLTDIKGYLEGLSKVYSAGTELNSDTYVLTWEWKFKDDGTDNKRDKADTFLGALAAGDLLAKKGTDLQGDPVAGTDYCLTPDIKVTITATQID